MSALEEQVAALEAQVGRIEANHQEIVRLLTERVDNLDMVVTCAGAVMQALKVQAPPEETESASTAQAQCRHGAVVDRDGRGIGFLVDEGNGDPT